MSTKPSRLRRLAKWLGSLGCLGCLGLSLASVLVAIGVVVGVGWLVQSRWERAVHWALDSQTGGEVDFGALRLGLGSVSLDDVVVRTAEGGEFIAVERVTAVADPWSFGREQWTLDRLELSGLVVELRRDDEAWQLPDTTLQLLRGEAPEQVSIPEVIVPEVVVEGLVAKASAPEGEVQATIARVDLADLVGTLDPALGIELGAVHLDELQLSAPGSETLTLAEVGLEVGPLDLDLERLELSALSGSEVRVDLGASGGWRLPDAALAVLLGDHGLDWPSVHLADIGLSRIEARASGADGTVVATVEQVELPALDLALGEAIAVDWGSPRVSGFSLATGEGAVLASARQATLRGQSWDASSDRLVVEAVDTRDVFVHARKGVPDLGFRRATWDLLDLSGRSGWRGVEVRRLQVGALDAQVTSATGDLDLEFASADVQGIALVPGAEPPWHIREARLDDGRVGGQQPVALVREVQLGSSGLVTARGVEVWTTLGADRTLDLPPVVSDHVPVWLGGANQGTGENWFGVGFDVLPWRPERVQASDVQIHLTDRGFASSAVEWDVAVSRATIGPVRGRSLPIDARATAAGGTISVGGGLSEAGVFDLDLDVDDIEVKELSPYLEDTLRRFGVAVKKGRADAEVAVRLRGSNLRLSGPAHVKRLELRGTGGGGSAVASVANVGVRAVTGSRPDVTVQLRVQGDLTDPEFSPVKQVVEAVFGQVLSSVDLDSAEELIGSVTGGVDPSRAGRDAARQAERTVRQESERLRDQADQRIDDVEDALGVQLPGLKKKKKKRR